MSWVARLVQEGGPTMYWIEYLAVPALLIVAVYVFKPQAWSRWATVVLIALILGVGVYGTLQGRRMTEAGIASGLKMTPAEVEEMRTEGYHEASRPIELAGVAGGVVAILFAIGEVRRRARAS